MVHQILRLKLTMLADFCKFRIEDEAHQPGCKYYWGTTSISYSHRVVHQCHHSPISYRPLSGITPRPARSHSRRHFVILSCLYSDASCYYAYLATIETPSPSSHIEPQRCCQKGSRVPRKRPIWWRHRQDYVINNFRWHVQDVRKAWGTTGR